MDNLQVDTFGLRINKDVGFTTPKNKFHKRTMNRQLRSLKAFAPMLRQFLRPDEEILLAVPACSPMSFFEQLTTGWVIFYSKRCVLVFTNQRILHFPTNVKFAPRKSIAQILYGDIADAKLSGFLGRVLKLTYRSGKKESFNYVQATEFKKLKAIWSLLPNQGRPSEVGERHHLCPRCQAILLKGRFQCSNCHLKFKDGERAFKLSILYPGGGYFYTNHPLLGIGDAIAEGVLLVALIAALVAVLTGEPDSGGWLFVIFPAALLTIEKAETIYHAKHYVNEYIPLDESFVPAATVS